MKLFDVILILIISSKRNKMITNFFPTPIISEELDMDLDSLSEYALSIQQFFPAGIKKSNMGGWHSNILKEENISNEELKRLLNKTVDSLNKYKKELNIKENLEATICDSWININRKGNINRTHVHPNCQFSATFYVKVEPIGDLSCLELFHPAGNVMDFCWNGIYDSKDSLMATKVELSPKPNDLYILPAWLSHSVLPHGNKEPRITITTNMIFV